MLPFVRSYATLSAHYLSPIPSPECAEERRHQRLRPAVEAFTRGGALGPVNIAYSGVYQWWYTIGLRTNEDLYTGALFLLFLSAISGMGLVPGRASLESIISFRDTSLRTHPLLPTHMERRKPLPLRCMPKKRVYNYLQVMHSTEQISRKPTELYKQRCPSLPQMRRKLPTVHSLLGCITSKNILVFCRHTLDG